MKCYDDEKCVPIRTGVPKWAEGNQCPKENFLCHKIVHIIVLYILNSVKVDKKMEYRMLHVQEQLK